jgi:hypothetical protein
MCFSSRADGRSTRPATIFDSTLETVEKRSYVAQMQFSPLSSRRIF